MNMEEQTEGDGEDGDAQEGKYASLRFVCTKMRIHVAYETLRVCDVCSLQFSMSIIYMVRINSCNIYSRMQTAILG